MRISVLTTLGSLVLAGGLVIASPLSAGAASVPTIGNDISYPQCDSTYPSGQDFGIVGVNHGLATTYNTCFSDQLTNWAALSPANGGQPAAAVYVNTGDPALAAAWWPTSNKTQNGTTVSNPHGTCAHKAGSACAYVYGYSVAERDADPSQSPHGVPAAGSMWWLDVETTNTWQSSTSANSADLAGMVDYFQSHGATVGLYSTATQWKTIAGTTSSTSHLAGLPSWIAGSTASGAPAACQKSGLTPGSRVALVQYHANGFDTDYSCGTFSGAVTVSSTSLKVGAILTASVSTIAPSSGTVSYQWLRNSAPISHATSATYKATSSDAGKTLRMKITVKKAGYTTYTLTSDATVINKSLTATPTPKAAGSVTVGHTLTASTGTWSPSPVTLSYQWDRDGSPIEGATARTYTLQSADVGHSITLVVTGSKTGYTSVSKTSNPKTIKGAV